VNYLQDNASTGRVLLPDLVRAFALIGIVLVNVAYFAYPGDVTYHAGGLNNSLDKAAYFGVDALFSFKSYTLFSFMFGVGLAYQMTAATRHDVSFTASYFRRLFGLIILGGLHVTLAFNGDILIFYAALGSILFLFRNASQKTLVRIGIAMVLIQLLVAGFFALMLYMAENHSPDEWATATADMTNLRNTTTYIYKNGTFTEVAQQRWSDWLGMVKFVAPMQAPGVLGFFLIGLAAARAGVLSEPTAPLWRRSRRVYLPIGLLISALGSYVYMKSNSPISSGALLGYSLILFAAPFSSLGYIGLIARWSEGSPTPIKIFFARGGTASLTAYLMQSLLLSIIFCGYGLGFYQKPGVFGCVSIAILTGLFSVIFASLWRTQFKRGPMELLLRNWTYLGGR